MIGVKAALLLLATTLGVQGQTPGNGTTPTGPHCVRGATYCGYILLHDKDGKIHKHKLNRRHGNFDCTDSVDTQVVPLAYCKPPKGASGLADDDICLNPKENRIGRCWEPGNLD
ncbi:hypothetical protein OOU_Y34scaffold00745g23 [Pyricularia oryzae Y34]|uniref:Secreted protein n=1 Tax=Pyricularia oryzae (strain Y34) TaxID=1143189 RepID=A0AA97NQZ0_PYRO3|nr:hypothetical protein OOU_Y34scaffold00745g23 [Pyricularia oryzae Y34]